jgi:hypothetical protein
VIFIGFVYELVHKYCCKSLNKQPSGIQEQINPFHIVSHGKNSCSLQTFRVMSGLQERIKFVNRGSTVHGFHYTTLCCWNSLDPLTFTPALAATHLKTSHKHTYRLRVEKLSFNYQQKQCISISVRAYGRPLKNVDQNRLHNILFLCTFQNCKALHEKCDKQRMFHLPLQPM